MEFIRPPNTLKVKVGGDGKLDLAAIKRAEAALSELQDEFGDWLRDEVERLREARDNLKREGCNEVSADRLQLVAHDLKGTGTSYGFPIVTALAGSLSDLIGRTEPSEIPVRLVDAHVDAIRAVVRDDIRSLDHPLGKALFGELTASVAELAGAARRSGEKSSS